MWARIENGLVKELTDIDPAGRFHSSLMWVACPPTVTEGMAYDNVANSFSIPAISTAQQLADFQQAARVAIDSTRGTFDRIAEGILTGKVSAADPVVQSWYAWRTATRACITATTVGTLPAKPTTYPAGT